MPVCDTFPCPACKRPHGLCVLVVKGGKRVLGVNCDDSAKLGHTRFIRIPQAILDVSDFGDLSKLPEYFTPPARKRIAEEQNLGMPLMFVQPGQTVERNIDLPRRQETDREAEARLQQEIDQKLQAAKELDDSIRKLEAKRQKLKSDAQKAGAQLSVVKTQPLELK